MEQYIKDKIKFGVRYIDIKTAFKKDFPNFDMRRFSPLYRKCNDVIVMSAQVIELKAVPDPPLNISERARFIWLDLWNSCQSKDQIIKIDHFLMAAYCEEMASYYNCNDKINNEGAVIVTEKGYPIQRPEVGIKNKAIKNALDIEKRMGINLSSRLSMNLTEKEASSDPVADLMNKKKSS